MTDPVHQYLYFQIHRLCKRRRLLPENPGYRLCREDQPKHPVQENVYLQHRAAMSAHRPARQNGNIQR